MPRKSYVRTPEILRKQSISHLGKIPYNKGIKSTPESRKRTSEATKKAMTPERRQKISLSRRGKKMSDETKKLISLKLKGKTKGSKHYRWQNGKTELTKQIRQCFEYRQWRSDIFTQSDFTCQKCGQRGKELHAHHKKQFALILAENNVQTLEDALKCSELWDLNNGETLCIPCHKLTDSFAVNKKLISNNK